MTDIHKVVLCDRCKKIYQLDEGIFIDKVEDSILVARVFLCDVCSEELSEGFSSHKEMKRQQMKRLSDVL